jgi:hypothetical protein
MSSHKKSRFIAGIFDREREKAKEVIFLLFSDFRNDVLFFLTKKMAG